MALTIKVPATSNKYRTWIRFALDCSEFIFNTSRREETF